MLPMLNPQIFPDDVLRALSSHMRNPKASTAGDPALVRLLAQYNPEGNNSLTLADVKMGEEFVFRSRAFKKLEKKRTRALCLDLLNQKKYLIPELAEVVIRKSDANSYKAKTDGKPFTLMQVVVGEKFVFQQRTFKKLEQKRTRALCLDMLSQKKYLIPEGVEVAPFEGSDELGEEEILKPAFTLSEVAPGQSFTFQGRTFRKLEKKRTRSICLDVESGETYSISESAEVQSIQS